jgi:flagellar hook-associated protein 1 FlgK
MSMGSAVSIAAGGLSLVSSQLALVSQNVANAGTVGYSEESLAPQSMAVGDQSMGVVAGPATSDVSAALLQSSMAQGASVAALQTTQTALQALDSVAGTVGQTTDLSSMIGAVQDSFSTLLQDPTNQTQQSAVVAAASQLTQGLNQQSNAIVQGRQTAQNDIVSGVTQLNQALGQIGTLDQQITLAQATGGSVASLLDARNTAMSSVAALTGATAITQPNGSILVVAPGGTLLPTDGTQITTQPATMAPGNASPPAINLGGQDITAALSGGSLGANITLRDQTLPTRQAGLDQVAQTLASRFADQGLTLFTDSSGAVPSAGTPVQAGYVGFSGTIQVNPQVQANPALVRDGTTAIAGSATGATAFTPNPTGGPAGFNTLITRVLNQTFGTEEQPGVPQAAAPTTGLGPLGNLSLTTSGSASISDLATVLTASQAQQSSNVSAQLLSAQTLQTGTATRINSQSGVNIDAEMSHMIELQNAYGANAKILATLQTMFTTLLTLTP